MTSKPDPLPEPVISLWGLAPGEVPDEATQADREEVAKARALKGDLNVFKGYQAAACVGRISKQRWAAEGLPFCGVKSHGRMVCDDLDDEGEGEE